MRVGGAWGPAPGDTQRAGAIAETHRLAGGRHDGGAEPVDGHVELLEGRPVQPAPGALHGEGRAEGVLDVQPVEGVLDDESARVCGRVRPKPEDGVACIALDDQVAAAGQRGRQSGIPATGAVLIEGGIREDRQVAADGHRPVADPGSDRSAVQPQVADREGVGVFERQGARGVNGDRIAGEDGVADVVRRPQVPVRGGQAHVVVVAGVGGQAVAPVAPDLPTGAPGAAVEQMDVAPEHHGRSAEEHCRDHDAHETRIDALEHVEPPGILSRQLHAVTALQFSCQPRRPQTQTPKSHKFFRTHHLPCRAATPSMT